MNWIYQSIGLKIYLTGSIETDFRRIAWCGILLVIQGTTLFLLAQSAACTSTIIRILNWIILFVSQASEVLKNT